MAKRVFTSEEFCEAIEEEGTIRGETDSWKFGHSQQFIIPKDGKFWSAWVDFHHSEGMQLYGDVECVEVEAITETITKWKSVN